MIRSVCKTSSGPCSLDNSLFSFAFHGMGLVLFSYIGCVDMETFETSCPVYVIKVV